MKDPLGGRRAVPSTQRAFRSRVPRGWRRALIAALLAALAPLSVATGQVVRGRLIDHDTERPIARGTVLLRDLHGVTVATAETDAEGRYRLQAPRAGRYLVEARGIGYLPGTQGPLELAADDDWETEYRLQALPVRLDPIEVTGRTTLADSVHLARVGFYHRQRSDFGHFMTRDMIVKRAAQRVTDLISGIPGVRMILSGAGSTQTSLELRGSLLSGGGVCHPRVFVDGIIVIRGDARPRGQTLGGFPEDLGSETAITSVVDRDEISLDDVVLPDDIEAVEVYRTAAQVPVRFGGGSITTQCGVIVIWTRRGRS